MRLNHFLCLSGCGYLREVITEKCKVIARIKAITHYGLRNKHGYDEVWINCEVTNIKQQARLYELWNSVRAGADVIVTFKSKYGAFINAHSGLTPEDPNNIVTLQGTLWLLEDSYVHGGSVGKNITQLCAVV